MLVQLNELLQDANAKGYAVGAFNCLSQENIEGAVRAAEVLRIEEGQSICFEPYMYHQFWSEGGQSMIGEVSTVNDDENDNRFLEPLGRYPHIDEDVAPTHLMCNEYTR